MKNVFISLVIVLALIVMAAPVAAQDVTVPVEIVQEGWTFWALLVGVVVVVLVLNIAVTVGVLGWVQDLKDRVPEWARPYLPVAGAQVVAGYDMGMDYLRRGAAMTPNTLDDELVELADVYGRRVLIRLADLPIQETPGGNNKL